MRRAAIIGMVLGIAAGQSPASQSSLLALSADGKRLLTANTDSGTVSVVDTSKAPADADLLREIAVGKKPEGVAWIGNGPLAIATDYDRDLAVIIDADAGEIVAEIAMPGEPYGVVVTKDSKFAYVTNEYPGVVSEIDLAERKVARTFEVGPYVRGIALAPDENRLYVTHYYLGSLSAVERASGKVVDQWERSPSDNLARHVAIHPTLPYAYVSHIRSRTERAHGSGSIFPYISVCDLVPNTGERRRHVIAMDTYNGVNVTCNPWESIVSPDGKRHYVVYAGTNDMNVSEVLNDGYKYIQSVGRLFRVGNNPRALAVSPDSKLVYVYNFLDFSVSIIQADPFKKVKDVVVTKLPYSREIHRGKILFNTANFPMTTRRWIACSSCHPDGDHDGRTWQNPEGLRRTTHFFGMKRTHPIHWSADRDEVQDFEHTIRGQLMQGQGLIRGAVAESLAELNQGRSKDLDALAAYCNKFEHRLSPFAVGPGKLTETAERGRRIFFDDETKCATCHMGPDYTDSSLERPFKLHDVGTGNDDPSEKMGPKFDTPTLLRVYRQTEYLHHGKAKKLEEVLTTFNQGDKHGKTSHLAPAEIADLAAFLKSLPYEAPPP